MQDIEKRKQELKREIEELQEELDHSFEEARGDLSTRLKPKNLIREYPLASLGIVAAAGFLLGKGADESETDKDQTTKSSKAKSDDSGKFGSHIWSELKRSATKRAVRMLMRYIDSALSPPDRR